MVEINMIKEGFVKNSLTVSGTVFGTQTVSVAQIDALVDEDFITTALTISGGESITLDADLGARWKLDRIEYFTDAVSESGITMEISDNNIEFSSVTMTGSPPKYVGDIFDSTISGAPQYIRLTHSGAVDVDVQEWRAVSDDSLVDFGIFGDQTQLEIDDAPIGRVSTQVEPLLLRNRADRVAAGFVFVDETSTDADDEIQISASSSGPFFGRTTADGRQPDPTPWGLGSFSNTEVVSSGSYQVNFRDNQSKGWTGTGIGATVSGGVFVGNTSTLAPTFEIDSAFVEDTRADPSNLFAFRARDFDRVRVRLKIPTIDPSLVTEGPRLFWRSHEIEPAGFDSTRSSLAVTSSQHFNNTVQDYIFNVDNVPTWSGVVRGFQVRPFVVTAGVGIPIELHEVDVFHSSRQNRVSLSPVPVNSGTFPVMDDDVSIIETGDSGTIISLRTRVTQPCIITKVRTLEDKIFATFSPISGIFLATLSGSPDPTLGVNYQIKRVATFEGEAGVTSVDSAIYEMDVFWPAEPGDVIGFASDSVRTTQLKYVPGDSGDSLQSSNKSAHHMDFSSVAAAQADIDTDTFVYKDRNWLIEYESISAGDYLTTGTYITPISDGGGPPALAAISFESSLPGGTSIDSGGDAFETLRARASETPPFLYPALGEATGVFYMFNDWPSVTNPHEFAINTINSSVTAREGLGAGQLLQNVAGAMFLHEQKGELWALNVLASGTLVNLRPTWDVFEPETGQYIRTQHVTGPIHYGYDDSSTTDYLFEPVAFIPDYDREEIYIIQRRNNFFVGFGSYHGLILDLDGNFKDVFMRPSSMDMPDISVGGTSDRLYSMGDIAYDGNYFYVITDTVENGSDRDILMVIRNGTTFFPTFPTYVDEIVIKDLPGLEFAQTGIDPKGIAYHPVNGLLYLYFENTTGAQGPANRKPELFTLDITPDNLDPDAVTSFTFGVTAISGTAFDSVPHRAGFRREEAGNHDDHGLIIFRDLQFTTSMVYMSPQDTFGLLQTREAIFPSNFVAPGSYTDDFNLFNEKSMSFFVEISAGTISGTPATLPSLPSPDDSIWGIGPGNLEFETVGINSVLFPPGRYAQVEYTLNASPDVRRSPYLLRSQLNQGLKIGDLPANGTKNIFLRTSIPEGKSVGGQQGRLKVFWQLEEG